jgi:hypothetical protein
LELPILRWYTKRQRYVCERLLNPLCTPRKRSLIRVSAAFWQCKTHGSPRCRKRKGSAELSGQLSVWVKAVLSLFLPVFLILYAIGTYHWRLLGDAALMHYIVFLMDHGMKPYSDIIDPNMPTTLLIQGAVVHLFGDSSLSWRLFDFALLGVVGSGTIVICRCYGWFAGVFAASLFALIHGRDGVIQLGQRDLTMTAFLVLGYAFLFESLRAPASEKTMPWMTGMFGICGGLAVTIKPSVLFLPPTLILLAVITLRRRERPFLSHIAYGVVGMLIPLIAICAYLARLHVLGAFKKTLSDLIPYFVHLGERSIAHLVLHSVSSVMLPLVIIWLPILFKGRGSLTWERAALLTGIAFGLFSFYIQRKGYPYHRYPSEAFLLILIGIDLVGALQAERSNGNRNLHRLAQLGVFTGVMVVGGGSTVHALHQDWRNQEFDNLLQNDLRRLGGNKLMRQVQCLDMSDGCITTLYNLRLVQATGFLYDCYMLSPIEGSERDRYREAFWQAIAKNPPTVFVVSSNDCDPYPEKPSYEYQKIRRWPRFDGYLESNYHLFVERIPPHMVNWGSSPSKPFGYRIYVKDPLP